MFNLVHTTSFWCRVPVGLVISLNNYLDAYIFLLLTGWNPWKCNTVFCFQRRVLDTAQGDGQNTFFPVFFTKCPQSEVADGGVLQIICSAELKLDMLPEGKISLISVEVFDGFFFDGFFRKFSCRTQSKCLKMGKMGLNFHKYFGKTRHYLPDRLKFVNNMKNSRCRTPPIARSDTPWKHMFCMYCSLAIFGHFSL